MRGYAGTDLPAHTTNVETISCPFTGEQLAAVRAINPDVAVVHAQQADTRGNVQLWGITGVQIEAVLAARRSLVTVEEIVDTLELMPGAKVIPSAAVSKVAHVPGGAQPSYALGYYDRDNRAYEDWDSISRDRGRFSNWLAGLEAV